MPAHLATRPIPLVRLTPHESRQCWHSWRFADSAIADMPALIVQFALSLSKTLHRIHYLFLHNWNFGTCAYLFPCAYLSSKIVFYMRFGRRLDFVNGERVFWVFVKLRTRPLNQPIFSIFALKRNMKIDSCVSSCHVFSRILLSNTYNPIAIIIQSV